MKEGEKQPLIAWSAPKRINRGTQTKASRGERKG